VNPKHRKLPNDENNSFKRNKYFGKRNIDFMMRFEMNPRRRIFLAGLFHETNTFVERLTHKDAFQVRSGSELFGFSGDGSPMDGFLEAASSHGWEVVPGVDWRASPSGPVDDAVFEEFWEQLRECFQAALELGIDAVFLVLHGAMATRAFPDAEGELLRRMRSLANLPLVAVLDLHANVSPAMALHADALVAYRENPHIDAKQTAVRAADILARLLGEEARGVVRLAHSGILLAPPDTGTSADPMKSLLEIAASAQREIGCLEIGIAAGFAHADTPDTGLSFWVVEKQSDSRASLVLERLCEAAKRLCGELAPREIGLEEAIDAAISAGRFPALLVEPADNIGGGAPGDGTTILRNLIQRDAGPSCVILNDPDSVRTLEGLQPGDRAVLKLAGKGFSGDPGPLEIAVELIRLTDGRFELEDAQSHLASMCGKRIEMGPSAVVRHGKTIILITSRATPPFDLGQLRSQGIEPKDFHLIGVKAAVGHKRAYDPITAASFSVSTPGPCSSDLRSLRYRLVRRPVFPLDNI
jgi:microcystin degradation protein MlrC